MKFITVIIALLPYSSATFAQRYKVVADMDTRLPLPGAVIATDNGQRATTDYLGRFHTQVAFSSATVSKKHYIQRRVDATELQQDTVFLIPQEVVLNDVVVTAPGMSLDLQKSMRGIGENAKLTQQAQQGFNLLGLFQLLVPSKRSKGMQRAEKIKKVLDNY